MRLFLNPLAIGFAAIVQAILTRLAKTYWQLTAYIPRRMPETEADHLELKRVLTTYFGLKDKPDVWLTVLGHLQSTPATNIRKAYVNLANPGLRLEINAQAQAQKQIALGLLQDKLKLAIDKHIENTGGQDAGANGIYSAGDDSTLPRGAYNISAPVS